jgi:hypothetical protein
MKMVDEIKHSTCDWDLFCIEQREAGDASKGPKPNVMCRIAAMFEFCKNCQPLQTLRASDRTLEHEPVAWVYRAILALLQ